MLHKHIKPYDILELIIVFYNAEFTPELSKKKNYSKEMEFYSFFSTNLGNKNFVQKFWDKT